MGLRFYLVLVCGLALPRAALAAGIEFPDSGALAVGRGGAVAAQPADGLAVQYNPAGLSEQTGLRLSLDAALVADYVYFRPPGHNYAANLAVPFITPTAGVASINVGKVGPVESLAFALGVTSPSGSPSTYDPNGAARYTLIKSSPVLMYYDVAVAARLASWISVGATFQLARGDFQLSQKIRPLAGSDPALDVTANVNAQTSLIPTGVAGITLRPSEQWTLGASYRPAFRVAASGTLTTQLPAAAAATGIRTQGNQVDLVLQMPQVARLGVQFSPWPWLRAEVDGVFEGWSVFKELQLQPRGISLIGPTGAAQPLPSMSIAEQWQNAYSVRLGLEADVVPRVLTLRTGYFYETSAIPTRTLGVAFPNWGSQGIGVGASITVAYFTLDVGYAHHFYPNMNVTDSIARQMTTPSVLLGVAAAQGAVVGNGAYTQSLDLLSVSLRATFDLPEAPTPEPPKPTDAKQARHRAKHRAAPVAQSGDDP